MKTAISTSTMLRHFLLTIVLLATGSINAQAQTPAPPAGSFPSPSGTFRLGLSNDNESHWLTSGEKVKGLTLRWKELPDTRGFILEVEVTSSPKADALFWSFGDCQPDADINVFSVEGQAFTCYYGESMKLRTLQAVTPTDDIRLSDGNKDGTPLQLYESGKRTNRPVLAGRCPLASNTKLYFCFYEQNAKADYNYFMLPELFNTNTISTLLLLEGGAPEGGGGR